MWTTLNYARSLSIAAVIAAMTTSAPAGARTPAALSQTTPSAALTIDSPTGIVADEKGGVFFASRRRHQVYHLSSAGDLRVLAGTGEPGYAGGGRAAVEARLNHPMGLAIDKEGNLYVADTDNNAIRKVTPAGTISTMPSLKLRMPLAVAVGRYGDLVVADVGNSRVIKASPNGKIETIVKGPGYATGVATDNNDNVYVAVGADHRILRIAPNGRSEVTAGSGASGFSGDGKEARAAALAWPAGLVVDAEGNVYIADIQDHRIRKVASTGVINTVAGSGGPRFRGDGGKAAAAMIATPHGVAADAAGNIFIADYSNHRIRMITPDGLIHTLGERSSPEISPATDAVTMNSLAHNMFAIDAAGNVYSGDGGRVRKQARGDGLSVYVAGVHTVGYGGDGGPATSAQLGPRLSLAVDRANNLYIADHQNLRIRKVGADGIIQTIAGNGSKGVSDDGGPATAAQFSSFGAIVVDSLGNLYIADPQSHRVRRVTPDGVIRIASYEIIVVVVA